MTRQITPYKDPLNSVVWQSLSTKFKTTILQDVFKVLYAERIFSGNKTELHLEKDEIDIVHELFNIDKKDNSSVDKESIFKEISAIKNDIVTDIFANYQHKLDHEMGSREERFLTLDIKNISFRIEEGFDTSKSIDILSNVDASIIREVVAIVDAAKTQAERKMGPKGQPYLDIEDIKNLSVKDLLKKLQEEPETTVKIVDNITKNILLEPKKKDNLQLGIRNN